MQNQQMTASILTGMLYCLVGSLVAGGLSAIVLMVLIRLYV